MFINKDPKEKFAEDVSGFDFYAALRQFVSDNVTFCFFLLAVSAAAAMANGAKGILSHRRVGTILLVIFVCRAYHAGSMNSRRTIVIKSFEDTTHDDIEKNQD